MMSELLKAKYFVEETQDYRLQALIYYNVGVIYWVNKEYAKAEVVSEKMKEVSEILGDTAMLSEALSQLGRIQTFTGKYAEAESHLLEAEKMAKACRNERGLAVVYQNMSHLKLYTHDYEKAISWGRKGLAHTFNMSNDLQHAVLGDAFHQLGLTDSAKKHFEAAIGSDIAISASAVANLADIYKEESDLETSNHYERLNTEYLDSMTRSKTDVSIQQIEDDMNQWLTDRQHHRQLLWWIALFTLLLVVSVGMFITMRRRKWRIVRHLKQQQSMLEEDYRQVELENKEVNEENQKLMEVNRLLSDDKHQMGEKYYATYFDLKELKRANSDVQSLSAYKKIRRILYDYKQYRETHQRMSEEDWLSLIKHFNLTQTDKLERLTRQYELDEKEVKLCCLSLLGISKNQWHLLLGCSRRTVYRYCEMLCDKLKMDGNFEKMQFFLRNF